MASGIYHLAKISTFRETLVIAFFTKKVIALARVVQKTDNTIHRINHYPADSVVCFVKTYPLDSDLSGG